MPSPSFQNMRSAPQKQPSPKAAVSRPAGYGPFSGVPSTSCFAAVGIGLGRPGSASAADGISSFFLNMNIRDLLCWPQYNECANAAHGLAFSHPEPGAGATRSRKREGGATPTKGIPRSDAAPYGGNVKLQAPTRCRKQEFG